MLILNLEVEEERAESKQSFTPEGCGCKWRGSASSMVNYTCPNCLMNSNLVVEISHFSKKPGMHYMQCSNCGQFMIWVRPTASKVDMGSGSRNEREGMRCWEEMKELKMEFHLRRTRITDYLKQMIMLTIVLCILIVLLLLK